MRPIEYFAWAPIHQVKIAAKHPRVIFALPASSCGFSPLQQKPRKARSHIPLSVAPAAPRRRPTAKMVAHNNVIANAHFKKDWQGNTTSCKVRPGSTRRAARSPVASRARRERALYPRPTAGATARRAPDPALQLQDASRSWLHRQGSRPRGIPKKLAPTIGIAVDHRRRNRSEESLAVSAHAVHPRINARGASSPRGCPSRRHVLRGDRNDISRAFNVACRSTSPSAPARLAETGVFRVWRRICPWGSYCERVAPLWRSRARSRSECRPPPIAPRHSSPFFAPARTPSRSSRLFSPRVCVTTPLPLTRRSTPAPPRRTRRP